MPLLREAGKIKSTVTLALIRKTLPNFAKVSLNKHLKVDSHKEPIIKLVV